MSRGVRNWGNKTPESVSGEEDGATQNTTSLAMADVLEVLEKHRSAISEEFKSAFAEISTKLDTIQTTITSQGERITSFETSAEDCTERIERLEETVARLSQDNRRLKDRVVSMEDRNRRNNLRIANLPESIEGQRPSVFFWEMFVELLGTTVLPSPPELDRCHRTLAPKPRTGQRPRQMIVCFHRYRVKELVWRAVRERGELEYRGHKLWRPRRSAVNAKR
ncbi:hypothetical protein SRHO_G00271220 [Serrasalmus rhombeus]